MRCRRLKRSAITFVVVYAALWVATAVWGPAAMVGRKRSDEDAYYGSMQMDPEDHRTRLHSFVVPAPFVVMADWDTGPVVGRTGFARGDQWGVWLPGRFWVVRHRMTFVACG